MSIEGRLAEPSAAAKPHASAAMQILGYGALVPLVAMAMIIFFTYPAPGSEGVLRAEVAYGAALLSFLGGIRWGIAVSTGGQQLLFRPLAIATLPIPFAWIVLFMDLRMAIAALMVGFLLLLFAERLDDESPTPGWYRALQLPFTIMVGLGLGVSLVATLIG
jgi:hypothetical protein